jgi:hypothetical protein
LNYRNVLFMLAGLTVFFMPREFSPIRILIGRSDPLALAAGAVMILLLFPYCVALIAGGANSPFIYYRF